MAIGTLEDQFRSTVSTYSPTSRVRLNGRTANAGTARRIATRSSPISLGIGAPTSFNLGAGSPPITVPTGGGGGLRLEDIGRGSSQPQQQEQGGWRGVLGSAVQSPVFNAVMAPLNILDYPRRIVQSTVNEVVDAFNGGNASWSDWASQVQDPDFGFGDMVGDSNWAHWLVPPAAVAHLLGSDKWADRFVGLSGDILMDPFTWLGGASALSTTGRAGRLSLASRAYRGGAGDLIEPIMKYGVAGLDDAQRIRLGSLVDDAGQLLGEPLRRSGLYFNVPLTSIERRIPGFGKLERGLGMGRARIKSTFNGSWLGRTITGARAPGGMEQAYQRLVHGRGPLSYLDAAGRLTAYEGLKEGTGLVLGRAAASLAGIMSTLDDAARKAAVKEADEFGTGPVAEFYSEMRDLLEDAGFDTSFLPQNYVNRVYTDAARKFMRSGDETAEKFRKAMGILKDDLAEEAPALHKRTLFQKGDYDINGRKMSIVKGTAEEINAEFRRVFPEHDFDLLETDFGTLATVYAKQVSKSVGSITARERLMKSRANQLRRHDDPEVTEMVTDIETTMDLNKAKKKEMSALRDAINTRVGELRKASKLQRKGITGQVRDQVRATVAELADIEKSSRERVSALIDQIDTLENAPEMLEIELRDQLNRLDAHFDTINQQMLGTERRAMRDLQRWRDAGGHGPVPPLVGKLAELRQAAAHVQLERDKLDALLAKAAEHRTLAERFVSWVDEPSVAGLITGEDLTDPANRRWIDGLGRERSTPPTHDVALGDVRQRTQLEHLGWQRNVQVETWVANLNDLPADARDDLVRIAKAHNEAIAAATTELRASETALRQIRSTHTGRLAAATEEWRIQRGVDASFQQQIDELRGRTDGESLEKVSALVAQREAHRRGALRSSEREMNRVKGPLDDAVARRDSSLAEVNRLQDDLVRTLRRGEALAAGRRTAAVSDAPTPAPSELPTATMPASTSEVPATSQLDSAEPSPSAEPAPEGMGGWELPPGVAPTTRPHVEGGWELPPEPGVAPSAQRQAMDDRTQADLARQVTEAEAQIAESRRVLNEDKSLSPELRETIEQSIATNSRLLEDLRGLSGIYPEAAPIAPNSPEELADLTDRLQTNLAEMNAAPPTGPERARLVTERRALVARRDEVNEVRSLYERRQQLQGARSWATNPDQVQRLNNALINISDRIKRLEDSPTVVPPADPGASLMAQSLEARNRSRGYRTEYNNWKAKNPDYERDVATAGKAADQVEAARKEFRDEAKGSVELTIDEAGHLQLRFGSAGVSEVRLYRESVAEDLHLAEAHREMVRERLAYAPDETARKRARADLAAANKRIKGVQRRLDEFDKNLDTTSASAIVAERDSALGDLRTAEGNHNAARERVRWAHDDIIDNGPSVERRAALTRAKSELIAAEKAHRQARAAVGLAESKIAQFERRAWSRANLQRQINRVLDAANRHYEAVGRIDRMGPLGARLSKSAADARDEANRLRVQAAEARSRTGPSPPDRESELIRNTQAINRTNVEVARGVSAINVPEPPEPTIVARLTTAYTPEDRTLLEEAYRVLRSVSGDEDPASRYRAAQAGARSTAGRVAEIEDKLRRGGLDATEADVLREELRNARLAAREAQGRLTTLDAAARKGISPRQQARETIARIEAKAAAAVPRAGLSAEAAALRNELANLADLRRTLDPVIAARVPYKERIKSRGKTIGEQVRGTLEAARTVMDHHAPRLIEKGAIDSLTLERTRQRVLTLTRLADSYAAGPRPHLVRAMRQEKDDLIRDLDVMVAYSLAIDAGLPPSPQLGAFILDQRLKVELAALEDEIARHVEGKRVTRAQLDEVTQSRISRYENKMAEYQAEIDYYESRRGQSDFNEKALTNAKKNRSYQKTQIAKLEAIPAPIEELEGAAALDELVEQLASTYVDMFSNVNKAYTDWQRLRGGVHDTQFSFQSKAMEHATAIEYLTPEAEAWTSALERLRVAIDEAVEAGDENVTWLDQVGVKVLDPEGKAPRTEDLAQALGLDVQDPTRDLSYLDVIPEYRKADLRRRVRINEVNNRARFGSKTDSTITVGTESTRTMSLEQARAELAKRMDPQKRGFFPPGRLAEHRKQLALYDGTAEMRIEELSIMIGDLAQPPSIAELTRANADLRARIDRRVGSYEQIKELSWQGGEMDKLKRSYELNIRRIEQAKRQAAGDLDPEEIAALSSERAELIAQREDLRKRAQLEEDEFFEAVHSISNPERFLSDMMLGRTPFNASNRERFKEMLGPELGELKLQQAEAMREIIERVDAGVITEAEAMTELRVLYGTRYSGTAELVGEMDDQVMAEAMETAMSAPGLADALPSDVDPRGAVVNRQGARNPLEEAVRSSLQETIDSAKRHYIESHREFTTMFRALGIELVPGESPSIPQLRRLLGINAKNKRPNHQKLKELLMKTLVESGYDPEIGRQIALREMVAKRERLKSWRASLGTHIEGRELVNSVDHFAEIENTLRAIEAGRDADDMLDNLVKFTDSQPSPAITSIAKQYAGVEPDLQTIAPPSAIPPTPSGPTQAEWRKANRDLNETKISLAERHGEISRQREELQRTQASADTLGVPTTVEEEIRFWEARERELFASGDESIETSEKLYEIAARLDALRRKHPLEPATGTAADFGAAIPEVDPAVQQQINAMTDELDAIATDQANNQRAIDELGDEPEANPFTEESPPPTPQKVEPIEPAAEGAQIPDYELSEADLNAELKEIRNQLGALTDEFGSFADAPPEIQQAMGQLAVRGIKVNEELVRVGRVAQLKNQSRPYSMWVDTVRSRAAAAARDKANRGTVSIDWESSLREGLPVSMPIHEAMRGGKVLPERFGIRAKTGRTHYKMVDGLDVLFGDGRVLRTRRPPGDRLDFQQMSLENQLDQISKQVEADDAAAAQRAVVSARLAESRATSQADRVATGIERHLAEVEALQPDIADAERSLDEARKALDELADETANDPQSMRTQARIAAGYNRARAHVNARYTAQLEQNGMQLGKARAELATITAEHVGNVTNTARARRLLADAEKAVKTHAAGDARKFLDDMADLATARRALGGINNQEYTKELAAVEKLLIAAYDDVRQLEQLEIVGPFYAQRIKQWQDASAADKTGKASLVNVATERIIHDGWQQLSPLLLQKDQASYVVATALADSMKHIEDALNNSDVWGLVDKYTAFFKAYATARPGFHVRNVLSGVFMNLVAGVPVRSQLEALSVWKAFRDNPREFWKNTTERNRQALLAVFASGGGGQFSEGIDLANKSVAKGTRVYDAIMNWRFMRWNRRVGERTEATMRLGMALDTMNQGGTATTARTRIAKYHFDYSETSKLDDQAKRLIPFWTFMSRNLPLQIEQMWAKPKMYLWYQSFVRNFGEPMDPLTPDYWMAQGAFTMNEDAEGTEKPWYLAPDLPHLRVAEPLVAAAQGDWAKVGLSDVNPLFLAPFEAMQMGRKAYTGAAIEGYEKLPKPMYPLAPLFALLGLTETGGTSGDLLVDQRASHIARSLLPPLDVAERLWPGEGDPESVRSGRELETWLRTFGAPVYNLTPQLRESTATSRYYDQRDQQREALDLARM